MSPAHTSELLFRTGTCARVTARPDSRGRVQVTFKDQAKFNLGINNLVTRSEQADAAASEMRSHVTELQSEFSEPLAAEFAHKLDIAQEGTYARPATETAELTDLPY
jgi:hypothetical protein